MALTRERIRQIEERALERVFHPAARRPPGRPPKSEVADGPSLDDSSEP